MGGLLQLLADYGQGQIEPLPTRFEKPESMHCFTGKIFFEPGNYPVSVNRATALIFMGPLIDKCALSEGKIG
jgi:hypothetical protein